MALLSPPRIALALVTTLALSALVLSPANAAVTPPAPEDAVRAALLAGPETAWTSLNMGPGSGLDADTLDGVHAGDLFALVAATVDAEATARKAADAALAARASSVESHVNGGAFSGASATLSGNVRAAGAVVAAQDRGVCDAAARGTMRVAPVTLGGPDGLHVCLASGVGTFAWKTVAIGVDLLNDPRNCGTVGNDVRSLPNAVGTCVNGVAAVVSCAAFFANADGIAPNGCEVDLRTSILHCGALNNPVPQVPNAVTACVNGTAVISRCNTGFYDRNFVFADGCESTS